MVGKHIDLFMFIDALGWEIVTKHHFLEKEFPHRYPVDMQFGYSSTAIPTILTGEPPTVHKHLSFYYYAPDKSPFRYLKFLAFLPNAIAGRWRFRHILSKIIAKVAGYTGYFEIYAMPFKKMPLFDYIEKKDIFIPEGLSPVENIADVAKKCGVPFHISNWRLSEEENVEALKDNIEKGDVRFAFLYTAAMDSLLHRVTKDGAEIQTKLEWYENHIRSIRVLLEREYDTYNFTVFSDHGMTTLVGTMDTIRDVAKLGFSEGKDYAAVYDSTMARFWFFTEKARQDITSLLKHYENASLLTDEDKVRYKIDFSDDMYGEEILLLDPGWQFEPCDMGVKALPAMHGYAPEDRDSMAALLSIHEPSIKPEWVGDYFKMMVQAITLSQNKM